MDLGAKIGKKWLLTPCGSANYTDAHARHREERSDPETLLYHYTHASSRHRGLDPRSPKQWVRSSSHVIPAEEVGWHGIYGCGPRWIHRSFYILSTRNCRIGVCCGRPFGTLLAFTTRVGMGLAAMSCRRRQAREH